MAKYLGIDWGERKIGLAVGSDETGLAVPHKIVNNNDDGLAYIEELCDGEVDVVVVGRYREKNKKFDEFVEFLNNLDIRVELFDERLTTKMAGKLSRDLNLRRGSGSSRGQDDAVAAQLILQGWMDRC